MARRSPLKLALLTAAAASVILAGCSTGTPKVKVIPEQPAPQTQTLVVEQVKRQASGFMHDWSPDGKKVVYSAPMEGQKEQGEVRPRVLWLMNRDGSDAHPLTQPDQRVHNFARWSPDGQRIAFIKGVEESFRLFVINADGSGEKAISSGLVGYDFTWSPDGRKVIYTAGAQGPTDVLMSVDVVTGEQNPIQIGRLNGKEPASAPTNVSILPDGRILFRAVKSAKDPRGFLYLADARGQIIRAIDAADFFSVSPDGKRVAYVRPSEGAGLYVADLEGGQPAKIVSDESFEPAWSPDGGWIAFGKSPNPQPRDLWAVRPDGKDAVQLTSNITASGYRWAPDGKALAFTGWNMALDPGSPEFTSVYTVTLGTK